MADSLGDLLPKQRFEEPPEVAMIKDFAQTHFGQPVSVTVQSTQLIIHVKSAAFAGALRMRLYELQELVGPEKRLVIRIG